MQPQTVVGGSGTGRFYPDWEGNTGTCLEDGNEPQYMTDIPTMWLFDSLEECCLRFYSWDSNSCLNVETGSGMWYADQLSQKCVSDCPEANGELCGGLANVYSDRLFADPRSCCESQLQWRFVEYCEAESFLSSCYAGTGQWYRDDSGNTDVCVKDCDPASKSCHVSCDDACFLRNSNQSFRSIMYPQAETELAVALSKKIGSCYTRRPRSAVLTIMGGLTTNFVPTGPLKEIMGNIGQTNQAYVIKTQSIQPKTSLPKSMTPSRIAALLGYHGYLLHNV